MGAPFSDRPPVTGPRYVFSPAITKGKPLKKTEETDAIFANVKQAKRQVHGDPETLEISVDTKAKVALGDYARGGKNPDGQRR
jgi:hypothetical protein